MKPETAEKPSVRNQGLRLLVTAIAMFGFGYALVPLYEVFCEVTGIGGKTEVATAEEAATAEVDTSRTIKIEFIAHASTDLPWAFQPTLSSIEIHPGEIKDIYYYARNQADRATVGQATFNVTPAEAGQYFKKTECFCFVQQQLASGEESHMLVRFMLAPDLPEDIHTVTLSYSFFNAEDYVSLRATEPVIDEAS